MQREPLQRVQEDLATIRAALGTELPHDRSHVVMCLLGGAAGLILAGFPLLGLDSYVRFTMLGYAGFMILAWMVQIRHLKAGSVKAAALWRWGRSEAVASLIAIALLVGYVIWVATLARSQGRWGLPEAFAMGSTVLFFLGVMCFGWVVLDRRRWPNLPFGLALIVGGVLLPLCATSEQFHLLLGALLLVGGISSGLLLLWQIRQHEVAHAD